MVHSLPTERHDIVIVLSSRLGLDLARLADLPESVISEARRVAEYLTKQAEREQQQSRTSKIALRRKALLRVMPQLNYLLCTTDCTKTS